MPLSIFCDRNLNVVFEESSENGQIQYFNKFQNNKYGNILNAKLMKQRK